MKDAKFIWTESKKYINCRKTCFDKSETANFRVCAFKKSFKFDKIVCSAMIKIFADTKYFMFINDEYIGMGPVCAGGDHGITEAMPTQYFSTYDINPGCDEIDVFVLVQLDPYVPSDTSCGRGGLIFEGELIFEDGEQELIVSDETWLASPAYRYPEANLYDYTKDAYSWKNAVICEETPWNLKTSQIPLLAREEISAVNGEFPVVVKAMENKDVLLEFDKNYSAYLYLDITAQGRFEITATLGEAENKPLHTENVKGNESVIHMGLVMSSASVCRLKIKNLSETELVLNEAALMFICYPTAGDNGNFKCSDEDLNNIYELGRHTLQICRQSIHLDSPHNQKNLGCVGDYYIESLIGYYTFSDTRLTRFDIIRIADYLEKSGGIMLNTTYSLIWVQMLYDYYMYTGDIWAMEYCVPAVDALMRKMESYTDEGGQIIENPPNWMFVDCVIRDGKHDMRHPPKAMGQAVLNAFYYNALSLCSKIFAYLGQSEKTALYRVKSLSLKTEFNKTFYDTERQLYFDGLDTPQQGDGEFLPANIGGRYFSKYANILAVLYGICDEKNASELLERCMYCENLADIQPYFMHFALEALYKTGLFEIYGIKEIRRWKALYDECSKGMKEVWTAPEGKADYSHAWSATPTYQLPSKFSGLEILEPGMKKIRLKPDLFGILAADVRIPTPYGAIEIMIGDSVNVSAPKEIEIVY